VCVCVGLHLVRKEILRMEMEQRYEIVFRCELQNAGSDNVFIK